MITISQILNYAWSNRGGWIVQGDAIAAGDGGSVPSTEDIEAQRAAAEAHYAAASEPTAEQVREETYRQTIAAGHCITPEGWCLGMDVADRQNWNEMLTLYNLAGAPPEQPIKLWDKNGVEQPTTLGRFREIILSLGMAVLVAEEARRAVSGV